MQCVLTTGPPTLSAQEVDVGGSLAYWMDYGSIMKADRLPIASYIISRHVRSFFTMRCGGGELKGVGGPLIQTCGRLVNILHAFVNVVRRYLVDVDFSPHGRFPPPAAGTA